MKTEKEDFEKLQKDANKITQELVDVIDKNIDELDDANSVFAASVAIASTVIHVIQRSNEISPGQDHAQGVMDLICQLLDSNFPE